MYVPCDDVNIAQRETYTIWSHSAYRFVVDSTEVCVRLHSQLHAINDIVCQTSMFESASFELRNLLSRPTLKAVPLLVVSS